MKVWQLFCSVDLNVREAKMSLVQVEEQLFPLREGLGTSVTPPLNSVKVLSCYAGIMPLPRLPPNFLSLAADEGLSITPKHN